MQGIVPDLRYAARIVRMSVRNRTGNVGTVNLSDRQVKPVRQALAVATLIGHDLPEKVIWWRGTGIGGRGTGIV